MSTVARLIEMLEYLPRDWEIGTDETHSQAFDHIPLFMFQNGFCVGSIDLDKDELNPDKPLRVRVNADNTIVPLGLYVGKLPKWNSQL